MSAMKFDVITLFPGMFDSPLQESIMKRAVDRGLIRIGIHDLRNFTHDRHRVVDDTPYGGGSGMVMKVEPIVEAIETLREDDSVVILLTPRGRRFDQNTAERLSRKRHIILICGRYEGIDERVTHFIDEEISLGDFILTGGEIAALAVMDALSRLVPSVLGCSASAKEESFSWDLLEYPHYTRPREFRGEEVPEILLSGNHEAIRRWRRKEALRKTMAVRPDLLESADLNEEDLALVDEIRREKK